MEPEELEAASKHFECVSLLTDIKEGDTVVYRYSLFPFALDQERELLNIGARPINTYGQHRYVADLQNYAYDLKELTPLTWDRIQDLPDEGPFILKGETNSKKSNWLTHMYAPTKKDAIDIYGKLLEDTLINQQKIYIRQFIPLKTYMNSVNGMPVTEEYRFFAAFGEILCGGYYWQNYVDDLPEAPNTDNVPKEFLQEVLDRIGTKINLVVIDVARTQDDRWIVVELNDLSMSGTSCNDLDILYSRLKEVLIKRGF